MHQKPYTVDERAQKLEPKKKAVTITQIVCNDVYELEDRQGKALGNRVAADLHFGEFHGSYPLDLFLLPH